MAEDTNKQSQADPAPPAGTEVAPGPHVADTTLTTRGMMFDVLMALVPAFAISCRVFGWNAPVQVGFTVACCVLAEWVFTALRRRPVKIGDLSAVVTGVIIAFSLPATSPWWILAIASAVAIGLGKVVFGGVGHNLFNPAMVGRAFVMVAFAWAIGAGGYTVTLTKDEAEASLPVEGRIERMQEKLTEQQRQFARADTAQRRRELHVAMNHTKAQLRRARADKDAELTPKLLAKAGGVHALTQATPMTEYYKSGAPYGQGRWVLLKHLFWGTTNGSLGETSAIALLVGGIFLCLRRTASWEIPAGAFLGLLLVAAPVNLANLDADWTVLHHLCGGAFLLGALFILTDPVSSPLTPRGKFLYGLLFGLLVMGFRTLSMYPEGVMFAVLLVNAVTPLLNRWTIPRPLGGPAPEAT